MLQRLVNWLALTRSEQKVLVFLSATLILGAGIRLYQETFPTQRRFDYRSIDSSFAVFRERLAADSIPGKQSDPAGVVNINTATREDLVRLPGIGPTLADRIMAYRATSGKFGSVEALQKVKGISSKKFDKLKPHVTIR
jgi:comEA protein